MTDSNKDNIFSRSDEVESPSATGRVAPTSRLLRGRLDCGLGFFVLPHEKPKHGIELRLVVKVGSLMEELNEQGLAHFIEHLGFKGTKNFARYELVRFLQSLGITYGPDLNASTHLLETVFQLSADISSGLDNFKHAALVLEEWAFNMNIDELDVMEEKAVIHAEYVAKQGVSQRLLERYWAAVFDDPALEDCRLAKRMPIGVPDVFMKTNAEQMRSFYEKWYTADNMSIVVVGDFAGKESEIVDILSGLFSSAPPRSPRRDPGTLPRYLSLPTHHRTDTFVALCDKELTTTQVTFEFFFPCPSESSRSYLRQDIIRRLICSVVDRRLHAIAAGESPMRSEAERTAEGPPFISAGISIRQIVRGLLCFGISATIPCGEKFADRDVVVPLNLQRALDALLEETKRFAVHGVTEDELSTARYKWEMLFQDQRDHSIPDAKTVTGDLVNHILCNEDSIFESHRVEAALALESLRDITRQDIDHALKTLSIHLSAAESGYYDEGGGKFRVVTGQFPTDGISDGKLSELLERSRGRVANVEVAPWASSSAITPADIIDAARKSLDLRGESRGCFNVGCQCFRLSTPLVTPAESPKTAEGRAEHTTKLDNRKKITTLCQPIHMVHFETVDATEIVLRNGIKVCLKWMKEASPNKVSMQAFALGGSTELSEAEEIVMSRLDSIAQTSCFEVDEGGSGPTEKRILRGVDVVELQSRMKTYVNTQRHHNHRGIGGSSPTPSFELLLGFVALKLTSQKILMSAVEKNMALIRSQLADMKNSPDAEFMEAARKATCGDIPISRPITVEALNAVELDMARDLYTRGFLRDPTEFTFVFVGDLPPLPETVSLLERYLSPLRPRPELEADGWIRAAPTSGPFTPLPAVFPEVSKREVVQLRQADKSSVLIVYRKEVAILESAMNNLNMLLDAMCRTIEVKLLDYLRIQLGKVYNVVVDHSRNSLSTFSLISIGFHCEPGDCGLIEEAVLSVLELFKEIGPDTSNLSGVKEALARKHSRDMSSSSHWLFWILDSYKDHEYSSRSHVVFSSAEGLPSIERMIATRTVLKLDAIENGLSIDNLRSMMRDTFSGARVSVVLSPSEKRASAETPATASSAVGVASAIAAHA